MATNATAISAGVTNGKVAISLRNFASAAAASGLLGFCGTGR
jgi:hypothetical protein